MKNEIGMRRKRFNWDWKWHYKKKYEYEYEYKCKWQWKGSYTVEAAFIFPIIFMVIALMFHTSIQLYENIQSDLVSIEQKQEYNPVKEFRKMQQLKQIKKDLHR